MKKIKFYTGDNGDSSVGINGSRHSVTFRLYLAGLTSSDVEYLRSEVSKIIQDFSDFNISTPLTEKEMKIEALEENLNCELDYTKKEKEQIQERIEKLEKEKDYTEC